MRQILNISLPRELLNTVKKEVATGHYASSSEFIRSLLREWHENKLLAELKESQKEARSGKGVRLKSLKDLRWKDLDNASDHIYNTLHAQV